MNLICILSLILEIRLLKLLAHPLETNEWKPCQVLISPHSKYVDKTVSVVVMLKQAYS